MALEDKGIVERKSGSVLANAKAQGADTVITACPLCLHNLQKFGGQDLPVVYFTELLYEALGL